jgi:PEP-CTERM motif
MSGSRTAKLFQGLFLVVTAGICTAAAPARAEGSTIDLGHPSLAPFLGGQIETLPGDERSVIFTAVSGFSISSAAIAIDPLQPAPAYTLAVDIYASGIANGPQAPHGALQASASASFTDVGLGFYDIPIVFTFVAGQTYDVAFRSVAPFTWGNPFTYNMQFYAYENGTPGGPYTVGPVLVLDGACHPSTFCGRYGNFALPHVQLNVDAITAPAPTTTPEPSTFLLLGAGLAAFLWLGRGRA